MLQNNEIWNELKELDSPLAGFARTMPYALPEGYFDMLAEVLAQGVAGSESDEPMHTFSKAMPFDVPEGYLAALPQDMLEAALENNPEVVPTMPHDVPDRYFASLPNILLAAAKAAEKPAQKGKIVTFRPQGQKRVIQWAVAAMLIMAVGLGTYKYMQPIAPDTVATRQLAKIDGDAIDSYVTQHVDEFDTETLEASVVAANVDLSTSIATLDEEEIREYLSDAAGGTLN